MKFWGEKMGFRPLLGLVWSGMDRVVARPRLTNKSHMKMSFIFILFIYLLVILRKIFNVMDDD